MCAQFPNIDIVAVLFDGANLLILMCAVASAFIGARGHRPHTLKRLRTAILVVAYGSVWVAICFYVYLFVPDLRSGLALLGALAFVATGCAIPTRLSFPIVAAVLTGATILLMQGAQLKLFVDGSAQYRYEGVPPVWALHCTMLVALIASYARERESRGTDRMFARRHTIE